MPDSTTDGTFSADVIESTVPVLVDFWAPWCGPCRMLAPILESLEKEAGPNARILKMNVDDSPQTAGTFRITAIPTVILFRDGEEKERAVGVQPQGFYHRMLGL